MSFRRMLMQKALPYDAEVEWLQSNGSQYIDLPLSVAAGDYLNIDLSILTTTYSGSFYVVGQYPQFGISGYQSTMFASRIGNVATSGGIGITLNTQCDISMSTERIINSDGTIKPNARAIASSFSTFGIFHAVGNSSVLPSKIYGAKITHNNNVVFDLIPVRVGTVGYMYDKVSKQLFGNDGSGSFTVGPDKN